MTPSLAATDRRTRFSPSSRGSDYADPSAALREIFDAPDAAAARERFGAVLERFEGTVPKVPELLEEAEEDLLAFYRSALRLACALLIEQNDEWLVARRYLSAESIALALEGQGDEEPKEVVELQAA